MDLSLVPRTHVESQVYAYIPITGEADTEFLGISASQTGLPSNIWAHKRQGRWHLRNHSQCCPLALHAVYLLTHVHLHTYVHT